MRIRGDPRRIIQIINHDSTPRTEPAYRIVFMPELIARLFKASIRLLAEQQV
jgi:hypothetical protein